MRTVLMLAIVAATGCGADEPAGPSCQQAMAHYYGAGCTFVDLSTGQNVPQTTSVQNCQGLIPVTPERCTDELDAWRSCLGSVKSPITNASDCDCSVEQEALLACN